MADLLAWNVNRAVDTNGDPAAGAKAYFYTPGTSTPKTVYSDASLTIPHSVPLVADAEGVFAQVYTSGAVKVLITDSADVTLTGYPMDPAYFIPASGSGADRITFAPTVDIPQDNVQDAIEQVQANLTAPLADLGLGVTGSADQLADIDATGIASGFYRYGTGTAGTYPSGVTAAAGGIVLIWRETAAEAHMLLMPRGATMGYRRTMTSTAWGSWIVEPAVLDEDDFASDSATRPPSQQSVKAYVDTADKVKAWVNFDGTGTVAIRAAYNVSSITDNGTGDYTANFTNALADANFSAVVSASDGTNMRIAGALDTGGYATTYVRIKTYQLGGTVATIDSGTVSITVVR